jgi:hypothetical protein
MTRMKRPGAQRINFSSGTYVGKLDNISGYGVQKPHGEGTMTYKDGGEYVGNWKHGKRSGLGKMTYAKYALQDTTGWTYQDYDDQQGDGDVRDVYEGNWENDRKSGYGKMTYNTGEVYEGNWENDKKSGYGKMTYNAGEVYEGNWENGGIIKTRKRRKSQKRRK